MTRPVRDDQHGTITGYNYGCRCDRCRMGRRTHRVEHPNCVSGETESLVLDALRHEADLDGLSTASAERLGELAGVSSTAVSMAVHQLAAAGRVKILGNGRGKTLEIDLGESA